MTYSNTRATEECPLTKDESYRYNLSTYCGDGLKFVISCFTILTIAITTTLIMQLLYADNATLDKTRVHGAVASDYINCSQIGTGVLRKGGNAVDAAVAAAICMTVVAPHKTGLGGGGYIMIYGHREQSDPVVIDFANNVDEEDFTSNNIRVPAILRGLEYAQKLKGKLPWRQLIEPSIILAKDGFVVSNEFASEASRNTDYEALYGHLNAGDILKLHDLANTLTLVADFGAEVLYNGSLSHKLLPNGSITLGQLKELANYKPSIYTAEKVSLYGHTIYHLPNSLALNGTISALEKLGISTENASSIETQFLVAQTLINATIGYQRETWNDQAERYTGVMVMDWEDTYVCVLTGLSVPLGVGYMTGAGFPLDKTRGSNDLANLLPIIFYNKETLCGLRGVIGTDDVVLAGQLLYNLILRGLNVSAAIEYPRYYLLSDGLAIESNQKHTADALLRERLSSMVAVSHVDANHILKSVNAIVKRKDAMSSHSDSRGGGLASRF